MVGCEDVEVETFVVRLLGVELVVGVVF